MMRHSEPVYGATKSQPAAANLDAINQVISEYLPLSTSPSPLSPELRVIGLRYFLVSKLSELPNSVFETKKLLEQISLRISEDILKLEDRQTILSECKRICIQNLLPNMTKLAAESLKFKLTPVLSVAARIDFGFAFEAGIKEDLSLESLLLDKFAPIFKEHHVKTQDSRKACNLIAQEYYSIRRLIDL